MMVIFAILGSIFSNKKKEQKGMPPFNKDTTTKTFQFPSERGESQKRSSTRSLEDFANEVFSQLNQKDKKDEKPLKKQLQQPVEKDSPVVSRQALDMRRSSNNESRQGRKEINRKLSRDVIKENEIGSFAPTTKKSLMQAIIASEIIGPPKSKQR